MIFYVAIIIAKPYIIFESHNKEKRNKQRRSFFCKYLNVLLFCVDLRFNFSRKTNITNIRNNKLNNLFNR